MPLELRNIWLIANQLLRKFNQAAGLLAQCLPRQREIVKGVHGNAGATN